jgi:hypothetical protein
VPLASFLIPLQSSLRTPGCFAVRSTCQACFVDEGLRCGLPPFPPPTARMGLSRKQFKLVGCNLEFLTQVKGIEGCIERAGQIIGLCDLLYVRTVWGMQWGFTVQHRGVRTYRGPSPSAKESGGIFPSHFRRLAQMASTKPHYDAEEKDAGVRRQHRPRPEYPLRSKLVQTLVVCIAPTVNPVNPMPRSCVAARQSLRRSLLCCSRARRETRAGELALLRPSGGRDLHLRRGHSRRATRRQVPSWRSVKKKRRVPKRTGHSRPSLSSASRKILTSLRTCRWPIRPGRAGMCRGRTCPRAHRTVDVVDWCRDDRWSGRRSSRMESRILQLEAL